MKIAVIVDNMHIAFWQLTVLSNLGPDVELLVLNCTNSAAAGWRPRHALYRLLARSARGRWARKMALAAGGLRIHACIDFEAGAYRDRELLPRPVLDRLNGDPPDLVLNFGMMSLTASAMGAPAIPILSYRHGDARNFTTGPIGFYEMAARAPVLAQAVQVDTRPGEPAILAYAETKIHRHSYRATLAEAYRHAPLLIGQAVANALSGRTIAEAPSEMRRPVPDNGMVLRFAMRLWAQLVRRAAYGAFFEKKWRVSRAMLAPETFVSASSSRRLPPMDVWRHVAMPNAYRFLADPFPDPGSNDLLVEGLRRATGTGEIVRIGPHGASRASAGRGHCSYPAGAAIDGRHFILPEIARWSRPRIFERDGDMLREVAMLDIERRPRLLDPTLFVWNDRIYLFANVAAEGSNVLRLWSSDTLFGHFAEHPSSPIRISPRGSRMAGQILSAGGALVRLGQDFTDAYGGGVLLFRIEALDAHNYRETPIGETHFDGVKGPHTINFRGGEVVFDWYRERMSPLAGARRVAARLR